MDAESSTVKHEIVWGDITLLSCRQLGLNGTRNPVGLLSCDSFASRQCSVLRTELSEVELDSFPGNIPDSVEFKLIRPPVSNEMAAEGGVPDDARRVHFGQQVLIQHVISGRFLCAGITTSLTNAVHQTSAEIRQDNQRMTLLPQRLARFGLPEDLVLSQCTFRFMPIINHGRAQLFSCDPFLVISDSGLLIRAGISARWSDVDGVSNTKGFFSRNQIPDPTPFDKFASTLEYELDISRFSHDTSMTVLRSEKGCFCWSVHVKARETETTAQHLTHGSIVRIRCLEGLALLWAPSAHPAFLTDGTDHHVGKAFEVCWHSLVGGSVQDHAQASTGHAQWLDREAEGVMRPDASFKGIFVLERPATAITERILFGESFQLKHVASGCYLVVLPSTNQFALVSAPTKAATLSKHANSIEKSRGDVSVSAELNESSVFDSLSVFHLSPTSQHSINEPIDANHAIGWLQSSKLAEELTLHFSGIVAVTEAVRRFTIQSLLPVRHDPDEVRTTYTDSHIEAEKVANTSATFVNSRLSQDLLQLEVVPAPLAALRGFGSTAISRVHAFEAYLHVRRGDFCPGNRAIPDAETMEDFVERGETADVASGFVTGRKGMPESMLRPLQEVLDRISDFLLGTYWPDFNIGKNGADLSPEQACALAFEEGSAVEDRNWIIGKRRRQALVRELRILDLLMIMLRAIRIAGVRHFAHLSPPLLHFMNSIDTVLLAAVKGNNNSQTYLAAGSFTSERRFEGFENGWLAEIMAISLEYGCSAFGASLRTGRPNYILKVLVLENQQLTIALVDDRAVMFLCKVAFGQGLNNNHILALFTDICASTSDNQHIQDLIYMSSLALGDAYFAPNFGMFSMIPSRTSSEESPSKSIVKASDLPIDWCSPYSESDQPKTTIDSTQAPSLLFYGSDRIFKICASMVPGDRIGELHGLDHWYASSEILSSKYRCRRVTQRPLLGITPERHRADIARFIAESEYPSSCVGEDEALLWYHGGAFHKYDIPIASDDSRWVDVSAVVREGRSSQEHWTMIRYFNAQIRLSAKLLSTSNSVKNRFVQASFSYEMLIVAINSFGLGLGLRGAFAELLFAIYVDRYPHGSVSFPRAVRFVNGTTQSLGLSSTDSLLPRFDFGRRKHMIHLLSSISLAQNDEKLIIHQPIEAEGDSFIYSASSGKFSLLLTSILDSLNDKRLIKLVSCGDTRQWTDDHINAFEFLGHLLRITKTLMEALFVHTEAHLQLLTSRLLNVVSLMKLEKPKLTTTYQPSFSNVIGQLNQPIENPKPIIFSSFNSPMDGEMEMVNPLSNLSERLKNREDSTKKNKITIIEGNEVEDDVMFEAISIATRRQLSLPRLSAFFGEANAVALLIHDEGYAEEVTERCMEYERWTRGQKWHHSQKVGPFTCPTNIDLEAAYCEHAATRKAPGARRGHLSAVEEHSMFGPSADIDNFLGLPGPNGGLATVNAFTSWQWTRSWYRRGLDPSEQDVALKYGGGWEYGWRVDQDSSWLSLPESQTQLRRRLWTRRRVRKDALDLSIELLRGRFTTLVELRGAIEKTRLHQSNSKDHRKLDLDFLLNQLSFSKNHEFVDEDKQASVCNKDEFNSTHDQFEDLGASHHDSVSAASAEETYQSPEQPNIQHFSEPSPLNSQELSEAIECRFSCFIDALTILQSVQALATDLRVSNLVDVLRMKTNDKVSHTTDSSVEWDLRRIYLDKVDWFNLSANSHQIQNAADLISQLHDFNPAPCYLDSDVSTSSFQRQVTRFIHRMQQAFERASVNPESLLRRFASQESDGGTQIDLISFQWLVSGIGYCLNSDDTFILKRVFCKGNPEVVLIGLFLRCLDGFAPVLQPQLSIAGVSLFQTSTQPNSIDVLEVAPSLERAASTPLLSIFDVFMEAQAQQVLPASHDVLDKTLQCAEAALSLVFSSCQKRSAFVQALCFDVVANPVMDNPFGDSKHGDVQRVLIILEKCCEELKIWSRSNGSRSGSWLLLFEKTTKLVRYLTATLVKKRGLEREGFQFLLSKSRAVKCVVDMLTLVVPKRAKTNDMVSNISELRNASSRFLLALLFICSPAVLDTVSSHLKSFIELDTIKDKHIISINRALLASSPRVVAEISDRTIVAWSQAARTETTTTEVGMGPAHRSLLEALLLACPVPVPNSQALVFLEAADPLLQMFFADVNESRISESETSFADRISQLLPKTTTLQLDGRDEMVPSHERLLVPTREHYLIYNHAQVLRLAALCCVGVHQGANEAALRCGVIFSLSNTVQTLCDVTAHGISIWKRSSQPLSGVEPGRLLSVHRGALQMLPWGCTKLVHGLCMYLNCVFLGRISPISSNSSETPTSKPFSMLPSERIDLLKWVKACGDLLQRYAAAVETHAEFINSKEGGALLSFDFAVTRRRPHFVLLGTLEEPATLTRDTIMLLFNALIPTLTSFHSFCQQELVAPVVMNQRESISVSLSPSSISTAYEGADSVHTAAHREAWLSVQQGLCLLVKPSRLLSHLSLISSAICSEFKFLFERELVPMAERLLRQLTADVLVQAVDSIPEGTSISSENGLRDSGASSVRQSVIDRGLCDLGVAVSDGFKQSDLFELQTDVRFHSATNIHSTQFGSCVSSLHCGGIYVSNIPTEWATSQRLSHIFSRFGQVRSLILRPTTGEKAKVEVEGVAGEALSSASIYFEAVDESQWFKQVPFSPNGDCEIDLFPSEDISLLAVDQSEAVNVRLVCLPTGTVVTTFSVLRTERVLDILQRICSEITSGVVVNDMKLSVNGSEVTTNYLMSTVLTYFDKLHCVESVKNPTGSVKFDKIKEQESKERGCVTFAVTWCAPIAAARCFDGIDPLLLNQLFMAPENPQPKKRGMSFKQNGSELSMKLPNLCDLPRQQLDGLSVVVEDSGIEVFWKQFTFAARSNKDIISMIDNEFDELVSILMSLPSTYRYSLPQVIESLVSFVLASFKRKQQEGATKMVGNDKIEDTNESLVMKLLCRIMEKAAPDKPFSRSTKWADVLSPTSVKAASKGDAVFAFAFSQGIETIFDANRLVVSEKDASMLSPYQIAQRHIQALFAGCRMASMIEDVFSLSSAHSPCHKAALQLGIHLLAGGNMDMQKYMHELLVTNKNSRFINSLTNLCGFAQRVVDRRAAAISLLKLIHPTEILNGCEACLSKVKLAVWSRVDSSIFAPTCCALSLCDTTLTISSFVEVSGTGSGVLSLKRGRNFSVSLMFEFVQLLCEGHFKSMQDLLRGNISRRQILSGGVSRVNSFTSQYMESLSTSSSRSLLSAAISLFESLVGPLSQNRNAWNDMASFRLMYFILRFITEMCQGPNPANQELVALWRGGAFVRAVNNLYLFNVFSHPLRAFHHFTKLVRGVFHAAVVTLTSLLEGRPCSLADPTVKILFDSILPDTLFLRLDIFSFLVNYFSRLRRTPASSSLLSQLFRTEFTDHQVGSQKKVQELYGPSFIQFIVLNNERASMAYFATDKEIEPNWMHLYSFGRHENVILYQGCAVYNLACMLHALEAVTNGKRFCLHGGVSKNSDEYSEDDAAGDSEEEATIVYNAVQSDASIPQPTFEIEETDVQMSHRIAAERVADFRSRFTAGQYRARRNMFLDMSSSIEVEFGEYGLVRVYFPVPAAIGLLSDTQKDAIHEKLDYTDDDAQVLRELFALFEGVTDEIRHKHWLAGIGSVLGRYLRLTTNEQFDRVPWYIAMLINFLIVISVRRSGDGSSYVFQPASFESGIHVLGGLLLFANASVLFSTMAFHAPLLLQKSQRKLQVELAQEEKQGSVRFSTRRRIIATAFAVPLAYVLIITIGTQLVYLTQIDLHSEALGYFLRFIAFLLIFPFSAAFRVVLSVRPWSLRPFSRAFVLTYDICTLPGLNSKFLFTIINVVALIGSPLLYSLQLLSILQFSLTLRNVVKAVARPFAQLSMTSFFGFLVIYIFMVVGFWAFPSDLNDNVGYYPDECHEDDNTCDDDETKTMCTSMLNCFVVFSVNGLLMGGGIGEFISQELGNAPPISSQHTLFRYMFDFIFFVIVTIGLLNLIFGIIIDTFSSIREKANQERQLMESKCTICGLTRQEFERKEPGGWQHHYKQEHNIWAYYSFLMHLKAKAPTEYSGLEDYVVACLNERSLKWLPRHRALSLPSTIGTS